MSLDDSVEGPGPPHLPPTPEAAVAAETWLGGLAKFPWTSLCLHLLCVLGAFPRLVLAVTVPLGREVLCFQIVANEYRNGKMVFCNNKTGIHTPTLEFLPT
jgi:hypothetical protein